MKSNLAKVSVALLSAVFILGCQDLGTGVVASDGAGPQFAVNFCDKKPNHPKCGGGDGGGGKPSVPVVKVTVAGGMTASKQDIELVRKGDIVKLRAYDSKKSPTGNLLLKMDMINTDLAGRGGIEDGNIILDPSSLDVLDAPAPNGNVICERTGPDKPPAAEVRKLFGKLVQSEASRGVLVMIDKTAIGFSSENHHILILDDLKVTTPTVMVAPSPSAEAIESNTFTATFSGKIRLTTTKHPDHFHLICDIQSGDEITFAVTPS